MQTTKIATPHPRYPKLVVADGEVFTHERARANGYQILATAPATPSPVPPAPRLAAAVAPPPSPIVQAERARALAIIAATPRGQEEFRNSAIREGMSLDEFKDRAAAREIASFFKCR